MRLIDADKLLDTLGIDSLDCEKCSWGNFDYCKRGSDFVDACSAIEDAPTVDAEPVVRCKDCRWQNTPMCWITYRQLLDDYDFCCGGIRREDE